MSKRQIKKLDRELESSALLASASEQMADQISAERIENGYVESATKLVAAANEAMKAGAGDVVAARLTAAESHPMLRVQDNTTWLRFLDIVRSELPGLAPTALAEMAPAPTPVPAAAPAPTPGAESPRQGSSGGTEAGLVSRPDR